MPCRLKIKVLEARDLPIMDRTTESADPYVEIKFGETREKTNIKKKSLNPQWNEKFTIEVFDDSSIQDEPIEFKVWDKDVLSSNDIIGVVYIDLDPLLHPHSSRVIQGWFPIYDTIRGNRGELHISIKLQFVQNRKDNSEGVLFFSTSVPFSCFVLEEIRGFVEELIMADDPEYDWVDNFRASRSSNQGRQLFLYSLSGKLKRALSHKVSELGGNAVLEYRQHFDFEETNKTIVIRGYGTACLLSKVNSKTLELNVPLTSKLSGTNLNATPPFSSSLGNESFFPRRTPEIELITLRNFFHSSLVQVGPIVMVRSVKLLSKNSLTEEVRNTWWLEVRDEMKSHALSLGYNAIVGYTESVTIEQKEDLCVLTAYGSSANIHMNYLKKDSETESIKFGPACSFCHNSNSSKNLFPANPVKCNICKKGYVSQVLLTNLEIPPGLSTNGSGCFIEARVSREKKKSQGEQNAILVSQAIPFIEYDIHRQLMFKLKVLGRNSIFGLRFSISVTDTSIVGIASGTAVFLSALPSPVFQISENKEIPNAHTIQQLSNSNQQKIQSSSPQIQLPSFNSSLYNVGTTLDESFEDNEEDSFSTSEEGEQKLDAVVVQMEQFEDLVNLLDSVIPEDFLFTTESFPGIHLQKRTQLLTVIRQVQWNPSSKRNQQLSTIFQNLYASLAYKLRNPPSYLTSLNLSIHLPEDDEVQIILTGMIGLKNISPIQEDTEQLQFPMDSASPSKKRANTSDSISTSNIELCELTPNSYIPGKTIQEYLGYLNLHFVRETFATKEMGGIGSFTHRFLNETQSIVRAHVSSLKGNALTSYRIDEFKMMGNSSNQIYILISVSGDVIKVQ